MTNVPMEDMGRGIMAPPDNRNIETGASEMRTLAASAATAIEQVDTYRARSVTSINANTWDIPVVVHVGTAAIQAGGHNLPEDVEGYLYTAVVSDTYMVQQYVTRDGQKTWTRGMTGGTWRAWQPTATGEYVDDKVDHIETLVNESHSHRNDYVGAGFNANTWETPGVHPVGLSSVNNNPDHNLPIPAQGWLEHSAHNLRGENNEDMQMQRFTTRYRDTFYGVPPKNRTWVRTKESAEWAPWVELAQNIGGRTRTPVEITGEWTTHEEEGQYLDDLAEHQAITKFVAGYSVEGRPIYGVRVGNPENPTLLIVAGQHGNEPGCREGAMMFARDLANAETFALLDMCVVVIPTMNPDNLHITRFNANEVDLNRDWADRTQPETQAVIAMLADYDIIAAVDGHSYGYFRQVSLRASEGDRVNQLVKDRAAELYGAIFSEYESRDIDVRQYTDEEVYDIPGMFQVEMAALENIPSLLLEVPSRFRDDNYTIYDPPPHWQAHMARIAFNRALHTVWRERYHFNAAKNG